MAGDDLRWRVEEQLARCGSKRGNGYFRGNLGIAGGFFTTRPSGKTPAFTYLKINLKHG